MTISKQIKKNIEEFDYIARQKSCIIINSLEKEAEFQELLENIKQSHISFIENEIENEIERLRGEKKYTVGRIVQSISDFENAYNKALQKQIDYYKKTLELIKEI